MNDCDKERKVKGAENDDNNSTVDSTLDKIIDCNTYEAWLTETQKKFRKEVTVEGRLSDGSLLVPAYSPPTEYNVCRKILSSAPDTVISEYTTICSKNILQALPGSFLLKCR